MVLIAVYGNAMGATLATESILLRPSVYGKQTVQGGNHSYQRGPKDFSNPPYPPIATNSEGRGGRDKRRERSFLTTLEVGGQFVCARDDGLVALDAEATASLVCSKWLENHNSRAQRMGIPQLSTYPAAACFKLGDG